MTLKKNEPLLSGNLIREAAKESLKKLSPKAQAKNPVMLIVYLGSIFTGALFISDLLHGTAARQTSFLGWLTVWLWFTVLFANFAESLAEGRAKAQANALRGLKTATPACRIPSKPDLWNDTTEGIIVDATQLRKGDIVLVKAGEIIPCDGEVVRGIASVNESAITGESAPVVRESGGDFSSVTGGTTVLSDWIVVRVESDPGDSFIDRMIAMVEGAARKRTPNEVALTILLLALSVLFLIVVASGFRLQRQRERYRRSRDARHADCTARLPHPHYDRGIVIRDRNCGHESSHERQRHCAFGPCC